MSCMIVRMYARVSKHDLHGGACGRQRVDLVLALVHLQLQLFTTRTETRRIH